MKLYNLDELQQYAKKYCENCCPLPDKGLCVISPYSANSVCILSEYLVLLEYPRNYRLQK